MVPDKLKIKNKINLIEIQQFCEKELHFVDQIVIKCDTQGFDAHILSRLTDEVWGKVIGGLLEITPIGNKTCSDIENLVKILGRFPKISFCPKLSTEISCEEVLAYWKTDSMVPRNLYFSLA